MNPHVSLSRRLQARLGWSVVLVCLVVSATPALGATLYANPGDNITSWINLMNPGDTLILNPGTYSSTVRITNKNGDENHWFTMRASDQGPVRILGTGYNNMFEIKRSSYWRIENLELDGNNYLASDAIKTTVVSSSNYDYAHHFVFDGLEIHSFQDNGFSAHITTWDLTIRNTYIHDVQSVGLYLGGSQGYPPIINLVFDHNFVEKTGSYNMQVKAQLPRIGVARGDVPGYEFDSWGWLIKDSVWMRTAAETVSARPNLLVDAAPESGVGSDDLATICGNVVLGNVDGAHGDNGFQLSGNLRVYNNVIMNVADDGVAGIRVGYHQGIYPRHLEILNNTVLCLNGYPNTRCLSVSSLSTAGHTQVIANNALIRGNTSHTAFSGSLHGGVVRTNNIIRGTGAQAGFTQTWASLGQIFINPVETPGLVDLYPVTGSPLINAGSNAYAPLDDFNGTDRPQDSTVEVGAYEVVGADNPGWQIDRELKDTLPPPPPPPTVTYQNGRNNYQGCTDSFAYAGTPDVNEGSSEQLVVAGFGSGELQRAFVRFDLSHIALHTAFVNAKLQLYTWQKEGAALPDYGAYYLMRAWVEDEVTWNEAQSGVAWSKPGGDFVSSPLSTFTPTADVGVWHEWDMSVAARQWIDNPSLNRGVVVKLVSENQSSRNFYRSSEYADQSLRPRLVFEELAIPLLPGDLNADGCVNLPDVLLFADSWGACVGDPNYNADADLNGDNCVNLPDLLILASHWSECVQ